MQDDIINILPHFPFLTPDFLKLISLFTYFWLCWVFVAVRRLSLVAVSGATLCCSEQSSHCGAFSCCRAQALGAWASVVVACRLSSCGSRALEYRLSSCGTWAQLLRGMWHHPGPGLEPLSPALAGGFLTTVSPGKSLFFFYCLYYFTLSNFIRQIKDTFAPFSKAKQINK